MTGHRSGDLSTKKELIKRSTPTYYRVRIGRLPLIEISCDLAVARSGIASATAPTP